MPRSEENIRTAFVVNLLFTLVEFAGGILTNSLAITADALHDLGDSFALGLAWFFERIAARGKTPLFSYGYRRFSLVSALINALILIIGSVLILAMAVPRVFSPEPVNAGGMILFAILGILANGAAAYSVHRGKTMNETIVTWHLVEDVLGWVGILVVSSVLLVWDLPVLDPLFSLVLTVFILVNVVRNFRKTLIIFLQGVPPTITLKGVEDTLLRLPGVQGIHDTHLWSLDGEHHILTTHLVVGKECTSEEIRQVKCSAREKAMEMGISHATLEIEALGEACEMGEE
jgi:cobalt-zinc-cadmium efflux system protein